MAEYVKGIQTEDGVKHIDYEALANKPEWDLLEDVTFEEEATFSNIYSDEYNEMYCEIAIPKSEAKISLGDSNVLGCTAIAYYQTIDATAYPYLMAVYVRKIGSLRFEQFMKREKMGIGTSQAWSRTTQVFGFPMNKTIIQGALPVGTTIKVYGRK